MTDPTPSPDSREYTNAPRWVKVFGIIAVVLVLLVGFMMLSGGDHGPGQHTPSGDAGGQMLLARGDKR
jgi:ABC-type transporter Mla subunit MlaD